MSNKQVTSNAMWVLTVVFLLLKLFGLITWPWVWVFSPLWLPIAIVLVMMLMVLVTSVVLLGFRFVLK